MTRAGPSGETVHESQRIVTAAARPNGPGRTVWLASYPKSGNTWMRAIVTALTTHRHFFGVNQLGSGSQPPYVGAVLPILGIDARWLSRSEIDLMRTYLIRHWGEGKPPKGWSEGEGSSVRDAGEEGDAPEVSEHAIHSVSQDSTGPSAARRARPMLRKTHELYRGGRTGREPFPIEATRAALLVVRDPRDVACSYAPFFGLELDDAVNALGRVHADGKASPMNVSTSEPWGSWSSHTDSWLDQSVPFPVHLVRFEDLKADAIATLAPVFDAIGLDCTEEELLAAVEQTRFDRLRESELRVGFRETSRNTQQFFRKGASGGWREELNDVQIAAIEADHAQLMTELGYPLTTSVDARSALFEVRESRRRQEQQRWWHLPARMGITVTHDKVPDVLPDAQHPRPWIHATTDETLVHFRGGVGLLVRGGTEAVVQWEPDPERPDDDPSWLVHGWAVTLAMLQRGDLSLRASTLDINGEIVAIAGNRGAGKSITAMALRQRGHRLLIDDLTLLEFRDDEVWTTPYARNVHLLPDAAAAVGLDVDSMRRLAGGRGKVGFRPEDPPDVARRIDRVVVLVPQHDDSAVTLREVRGGARLANLVAHTRREGIAPLVLGHERYFELLAQLANTVPLQVLNRPTRGWTLAAVADAIEGGVLSAQGVQQA